MFNESRKFFEPGWTMQDNVADPRFESLPADISQAADLRLQPDSPAVKVGESLPAYWPDPYRTAANVRPDIGALPLGMAPWGVGVNGRISLSSGLIASE